MTTESCESPFRKRRKTTGVLVLLLFLSLLDGCSAQEPVPPEDPASVPLATFTADLLGIVGLRPERWTETYPGTFRRATTQSDHTVLVQRSFPGIDADWLVRSTILSPGSPLRSLGDPLETRQAHGLSWRVHRVALILGGESWVLGLALAETPTHTFVVALLCRRGEADASFESVFLPAVEAFTFAGESGPGEPDGATRGRFVYDAGHPLNVTETGRTQVDGITQIELSFDSPKGGRVPATLMVPPGEGPFPALVYQHGFPSTRQPVLPWAREYAKKGVVAIAIDAPWARPDRSGRSYPLTFSQIDAEEQVQLMMDLRRAVDLLVARPEVDPEQMVYVGVSYGGAMGGLLAGVERRLKAYVLVVGDGGLVEHFFGLEDVLFGQDAMGDARAQRAWYEAMRPVEPLSFVALGAPAALLFQNGRTDVAVPAPDALRYQRQGSQPKTVLWYPTGHNRTPEMQADQETWLRQFITLR